MPQDKFTAVWVSHSSINNYLKCPRAYYLNNVYKDPKTHHKISLISPPLALGQVVHEVVESLSVLPVNSRFKEPLVPKFNKIWEKVTGKKGGFSSKEQELQYKKRGEEMLGVVLNNPGPLKNLAIKIDMELPQYWLSDDDNIILCGKIDWLEYLPENDSVHIIDFKTGKKQEDTNSLQLPIYHLLAHNCQTRPVEKVSYWYLSLNNAPTPKKLPDLNSAHKQVLKIAKEIKLARALDRFKCPKGSGCSACKPLENIIQGKAELVGTGNFNQDVYILPLPTPKNSKSSKIL